MGTQSQQVRRYLQLTTKKSISLEDGNADKETEKLNQARTFVSSLLFRRKPEKKKLKEEKDDDEDSFLYGDTVPTVPPVQKAPDNTAEDIPSVTPEPSENQTNGIVAHLEAGAEDDVDTEHEEQEVQPSNGDVAEKQDESEPEEDVEGEEEDSDEEIEFILEPPTRSLDFRNQRGGHRPVQARTPSAAPPGALGHATNLTTEYTPRERGAPPEDLHPSAQAEVTEQSGIPQISPPTPTINVAAGSGTQYTIAEQAPGDDGPDPSTLPAVRALPSHPHIDPNATGLYEGRPIFDVDMTNLADRPWRRPGSDLSDWFNYGFDEISWEAYCYRRRSMGDMADVLRVNVLGFAGMQEEQLLALPPEARTMVMTGTNALMTGGGGGPNGPPGVGVGPGMMPPVGMNPMGPMNAMMAAEMGGMGGMGPMDVGMGGPMGMGMNGDMGVGMPGPGQGPGPMMQGGVPGGSMQVVGQGPGGPGQAGTPEQGGQMSLSDGMPGGPAGMMGMNMNMGPDFNPMQMQQDGNMPGQQMHQIEQQINSSNTPTPVPGIPPRVGSTPVSFRGRGMGAGVPAAPRGGRAVPTFPARGRGRGGLFEGSSLPVRPASPLPPNVPTGPRNPGNRYKDRDNNAPAVEGLDYGGNKEGSVGTPTMERDRVRDKEREREHAREREAEEKITSRKRRSPPSNEEDRQDRLGRSSKRR